MVTPQIYPRTGIRLKHFIAKPFGNENAVPVLIIYFNPFPLFSSGKKICKPLRTNFEQNNQYPNLVF